MVCYIRALVGLNRISSIVGPKTLDLSQESTCSKEIIVFCEYNDTQVPKLPNTSKNSRPVQKDLPFLS